MKFTVTIDSKADAYATPWGAREEICRVVEHLLKDVRKGYDGDTLLGMDGTPVGEWSLDRAEVELR